MRSGLQIRRSKFAAKLLRKDGAHAAIGTVQHPRERLGDPRVDLAQLLGGERRGHAATCWESPSILASVAMSSSLRSANAPSRSPVRSKIVSASLRDGFRAPLSSWLA